MAASAATARRTSSDSASSHDKISFSKRLQRQIASGNLFKVCSPQFSDVQTNIFLETLIRGVGRATTITPLCGIFSPRALSPLLMETPVQRESGLTDYIVFLLRPIFTEGCASPIWLVDRTNLAFLPARNGFRALSPCTQPTLAIFLKKGFSPFGYGGRTRTGVSRVMSPVSYHLLYPVLYCALRDSNSLLYIALRISGYTHICPRARWHNAIGCQSGIRTHNLPVNSRLLCR